MAGNITEPIKPKDFADSVSKAVEKFKSDTVEMCARYIERHGWTSEHERRHAYKLATELRRAFRGGYLAW